MPRAARAATRKPPEVPTNKYPKRSPHIFAKNVIAQRKITNYLHNSKKSSTFAAAKVFKRVRECTRKTFGFGAKVFEK